MNRSLIVILLLVICSQLCSAEILTFNTYENPFGDALKSQGWMSNGARIMNGYNPNNSDYVAGLASDGSEIRNFFSFDLSSLSDSDEIAGATLELTKFQYYSEDSSETYGLFHVDTLAATLNNRLDTRLDEVIFNDLGTGVSYGEFEISKSGVAGDVLSFELNNEVISAINTSIAGDGWFSVGGAVSSLGDSGVELIFASGGYYGTQRLLVNVVPEPASIILLSSGLLFLRRKKVLDK